MRQWVVDWTMYCKRVVDADEETEAIELALGLGPEESVMDDLEPPKATPIPEEG